MEIRKTAAADVRRIMEIYACARRFMAEHGNPDQWGPRSWPPEELIINDISEDKSYVCVNDEGQIVGTFFYDYGTSVEPTYSYIEGAWLDDNPYGVVHRIASDGSQKGVGSFCLNWALERSPHLRIDTHRDNYVMQSLLKKLGFVCCGVIYVEGGTSPRLAFEKTDNPV